MHYFVGWDVGAWHCSTSGSGSKDALAVLDQKRHLLGVWEGNLSQYILQTASQSPPAEFFLKIILSLCEVNYNDEVQAEDAYVLAIDTPLGWPTEFRKLLCPGKESDGGCHPKAFKFTLDSKISNPFLHRKTERMLGKALSTVQDQIGSQSTKALFLLQSLQATSTAIGVWSVAGTNLSLIETYPSPCVRSLTFLERMKAITAQAEIASTDIFDAIVCASLAFAFWEDKAARSRLRYPCESIDPEEGWIFTPVDCLTNSVGISYGNLLSPPKPLKYLLSQIQVALILTAVISAKKKTTSSLTSLLDLPLLRTMPSNVLCHVTNGVHLRTMFNLLHPKTKPDQIPSDAIFEEIAGMISGPS